MDCNGLCIREFGFALFGNERSDRARTWRGGAEGGACGAGSPEILCPLPTPSFVTVPAPAVQLPPLRDLQRVLDEMALGVVADPVGPGQGEPEGEGRGARAGKGALRRVAR